jgi:predicted AlkP superfamily phosphohydrolase/phosphomutase
MSLAALSSACASLFTPHPTQRVVILGVDGMDPDLAEVWMREGRLPNLAALAARGGFYPLRTISAPSCEAAWTTIAAGRDMAAPIVRHEPAQLLLNFAPFSAETWTTTRSAPSFWTIAGEAGVRSSIIAVPGTFPPERVPNAELLAGLPLPDIRKTQGTYQFFATTVSASEEGTTPHGGLRHRLVFDNRVARVQLLGPLHPVSRDQLTIPMEITWNHEARSANIAVGPHVVHLREREWSRWLELDFAVSPLINIRGFAQLFLIRAGTQLQLYVSPVHWHPADPPAPISSPPAFARQLYERLGLFRTHGWNAATAALADEHLDEAAFLDDIDRAFQDRAETILNRLDAGEWDLLIGVVDMPDRVQHMMWRLTDRAHPRYDGELARRYAASIEQSYRQADDLLGEIVSRLRNAPETLVLVVSDHGFHAVRTTSKWSGDHTAEDASTLSGVLVSSQPLAVSDPHLSDIAATVLKYFNVPRPATVAGRPLLDE